MTSFKETDIRPDDMADYQQKYIVADRQRLLSYKNKFINVSCPACSSENSIKAFNKNDLNYINCEDCGTMYINPRPTEEILKVCYSNSEVYEYWNKSIFPNT